MSEVSDVSIDKEEEVHDASAVYDEDLASENETTHEDEIIHQEDSVYEDYVVHEDDSEHADDTVHEGDVVDEVADGELPDKDTAEGRAVQTQQGDNDDAGTVDDDEEPPAGKTGNDYKSIEKEIRAELDGLDMITISAIAIMISGANSRASSPYIDGLKKVDIKKILMTFLEDTHNLSDINEIDKLFSKKYYKKIIRKYLHKITVHVRHGISDSLPRKNMWLLRRMKISMQRSNIYIDKICESVKSFESVKFIPALSGNQEASISKRNYKLDHLSDHYKDALIYLTDVLVTCTCISKMMFVERMIRKIPADSEFAKIIENMTQSFSDINIIINKSRPIYKQFYQAQLGHINGDDLLYGMAVTIMVNNITRTGIMNKDLLKLEFSFDNAGELINNMMLWLDFLAKYDYTTDIGSLILQRISLLVKGNSDMLLAGLGEFLNLEEFFDKRIAYYRKLRDKERYLKGDMTKEILEMTSFTDYTDEA